MWSSNKPGGITSWTEGGAPSASRLQVDDLILGRLPETRQTATDAQGHPRHIDQRVLLAADVAEVAACGQPAARRQTWNCAAPATTQCLLTRLRATLRTFRDASLLPTEIVNGSVYGSARSHVTLSLGNLRTALPPNFESNPAHARPTTVIPTCFPLAAGHQPHVRIGSDSRRSTLGPEWLRTGTY